MPPKVNVNVELQNLHKLILEIKTNLLNKATSSKLDELKLPCYRTLINYCQRSVIVTTV